MMRSTADVNREIRRIVGARVEAGMIVRVEWLTHEILALKSNIEGEDAAFYVACGVKFIRDAVRDCVGAYKPKPTAEPDVQIVMEGFDYMQRAYTVSRESEVLLVPVDQMTDTEIEARAVELEAMARGCITHARELRNYAAMRQAA